MVKRNQQELKRIVAINAVQLQPTDLSALTRLSNQLSIRPAPRNIFDQVSKYCTTKTTTKTNNGFESRVLSVWICPQISGQEDRHNFSLEHIAAVPEAEANPARMITLIDPSNSDYCLCFVLII